MAGAAVAHEIEEQADAGEGSEDQAAAPVPVTGQVAPGPIVVPATRSVGGTSTLEGEVLSSRDVRYIREDHGLPSGETVYQRGAPEPDVATPPPANSVGEVEVYRRPAGTHPDDELVTCPWCHGEGCAMCEGEGYVPKWVRDEALR